MSENKIGFALVHEICPICGKPMNEQIQRLLQYDNYKDIYYVRNNNKFNFYLKTYSND